MSNVTLPEYNVRVMIFGGMREQFVNKHDLGAWLTSVAERLEEYPDSPVEPIGLVRRICDAIMLADEV